MNKKILKSELIKYKENFISYSGETELIPGQLRKAKNKNNFLNNLHSLWIDSEDLARYSNSDYELENIYVNYDWNSCNCWFEVRKDNKTNKITYESYYGWDARLEGQRDFKEFDTLDAMLTDYFYNWHKIVCDPYFKGLKLDRQLNLEELRHIMGYSQERGYGDINAEWLIDSGMINEDQNKCLIHSDYEKHHVQYFPSKTHDISHTWNCPSLQIIYRAWRSHEVKGGIDQWFMDSNIDCAICDGQLTWFECLEVDYNEIIKVLN